MSNSLIASGLAALLAFGGSLGSPSVDSPGFPSPQLPESPGIEIPAPELPGENDQLSEVDKDLLVALDEERMARDLYLEFNKLYPGTNQFENIPNRGEQGHMDAIKAQIDARGLDGSNYYGEPGKYQFPEVQAMYDAWLLQGKISKKQAFQAAVDLEKQDIIDLTAMKDRAAAAGETELVAMYEHLIAGSENHIVAFTRGLEGGGGGGRGPGGGGGGGYRGGR
ncbi:MULTISPECIES: DUF2202 domain-containing protein [unclassified Corynebacterium]|uniref:DUF2202 domain-containing protein n=1 Tax=unclassified Corynebacterium TaxID=2624378 RepID=UPI003099EC82